MPNASADEGASAAISIEPFFTHDVENQAPPLRDYNAYESDAPLRDAVEREHAAWAGDALAGYGAVSGGELLDLGFAANENKPKLKTFDRYGHRIDEVEFHPAYHRVMTLAMQHGVHSFAWRHQRPGAQVARSALAYLHYQAEAGTSCPLTMTYAAVPALKHAPTLAAQWLPRITSLEYDARVLPAADKRGCTIGMGMTEKQGGSDVRANTSRAFESDDGYRIVGHKWFFSAPMCDAWLVLAQAGSGLSCFLMPKLLPDGTRNAIRIQRLKDKLGDWSNASSEVEFQNAWAERVGEEGRGVATILEMVALTRLDCMTGSAALMRQALVQAIHHCRHRKAFGRLLVEQPLMKNVLADLAIETEAATALAMRTARAVDSGESALARILTAAGKYWNCKRAPALVNEAQECLGGAGYVEESIMPRLYRQAPLNSIWEGSGNVQCLDVLRALGRDSQSREALFTELSTARGADRCFDGEVSRLATALDDPGTWEVRSRDLVERMALCLQGALLLRAGDPVVAQAFCGSRLGGEHGLAFGTLLAHTRFDHLIDRAWPA
ncbi:MAG: acyl-CoA dehydrogenase, C-terminal domain protein [Hydrocarboniphaga sp.]|uniref:isovaleryl-CoA dehydrogenase n=1 Tax=Hydrocarboniphaga sp. TaxID=2033016 RepID=UPI002633E607|nr:isovaleryl-CoA dehydrogenase [Hydrocarboniphaga sp.]MDB5971763.1 acyl-CoA dehydrogenase, C-terminal domain protein [Hydrocarboniphaga sp.]